jgi:hypothetical protein
MKKVLLGLTLVLAIAISIVSGTMALYTTRIDKVTEGSVVAKQFILVKGGTDTFVQNLKIAPAETVEWAFSVSNFEGKVVSETAMGLSFTINITESVGRKAIEPLVVTIRNKAGEVVGKQTGTGSISFSDKFELAAEGQTHTYYVTIEWPSGENDASYISQMGSFGTSISIGVTGTQH